MRHRHGYRKLNRTSSHRKALLKNLAIALIQAERIETTIAKAKTLRSYVEKLVTKAKIDDFNSHRIIFKELQDKEATKKIMNDIAQRFSERNGGYTRIRRTKLRRGDASQMALIEFV